MANMIVGQIMTLCASPFIGAVLSAALLPYLLAGCCAKKKESKAVTNMQPRKIESKTPEEEKVKQAIEGGAKAAPCDDTINDGVSDWGDVQKVT